MGLFDPMRYIREQLEAGASEQDIQNVLRNRGILSDVSEVLIRQVKESEPEMMAHRRRRERRTWFWPVGIGVGLMALGLAISTISYAAAGPGGTYIVASGLVLVGVLSVLKGTWHLIRWW